jgi:hypothetical protein
LRDSRKRSPLSRTQHGKQHLEAPNGLNGVGHVRRHDDELPGRGSDRLPADGQIGLPVENLHHRIERPGRELPRLSPIQIQDVGLDLVRPRVLAAVDPERSRRSIRSQFQLWRHCGVIWARHGVILSMKRSPNRAMPSGIIQQIQ